MVLVLTSCATPTKTYDVLVVGNGTEFVLKVESKHESQVRSDARELLADYGFTTEQLNLLKFKLK